jgi:hypothetical protein
VQLLRGQNAQLHERVDGLTGDGRDFHSSTSQLNLSPFPSLTFHETTQHTPQ